MGLIKEFQEFAVKGNAIDMAVGIVIGASFGLLVKSLVDDILMPPLGMAMGGADFSAFKVVLRGATLGPDGTVITPEVAIRYGQFINVVINFVIVAFALFMVVKMVNKLRTFRAPVTPV